MTKKSLLELNTADIYWHRKKDLLKQLNADCINIYPRLWEYICDQDREESCHHGTFIFMGKADNKQVSRKYNTFSKLITFIKKILPEIMKLSYQGWGCVDRILWIGRPGNLKEVTFELKQIASYQWQPLEIKKQMYFIHMPEKHCQLVTFWARIKFFYHTNEWTQYVY